MIPPVATDYERSKIISTGSGLMPVPDRMEPEYPVTRVAEIIFFIPA
jgi:hypothetical protein